MTSDSSHLPDHQRWMRLALTIAGEAGRAGEVPVGAVLVAENQEIGRGSNAPIGSHDPTAHAEIIALRQAADRLNNYRLTGTTLYVTVEPCMMCAGALVHARVQTLVFGTREPKAGVIVSHPAFTRHDGLNHSFTVVEGILGAECAELMQQFFAQLRAASKLQ